MMKNKYKVLIMSCWALLAVCLVIKLFGAELFTIVCENEKFIRFCDYLDEHIIAKYVFSTILYIPATYLVYLAMVKREVPKDWFVIILCIPCSFMKANYPIIGMIYELILMIVLPLVTTKGKRWKQIILGVALVFVFQIISMLIRNIGELYIYNENTVIGYMLLIDYYIMVGLYYLYSNRKEIK